MLERLIRLSIRCHWLLLLIPLLAQYYVGATLLSRTPLIKLPNLLDSLPWSSDTLFEAHIVIGNLLVMAASFLTFEKMIVVLKPIIRAPIANGFISAHVQGHFLSFSMQLMFQWVTMNASDSATKFLKEYANYDVPKGFWTKAHAANALMMVVHALILTVWKFYIIAQRQPKQKTN